MAESNLKAVVVDTRKLEILKRQLEKIRAEIDEKKGRSKSSSRRGKIAVLKPDGWVKS